MPTMSLSILVVTKGHPFDAPAFFAMWDLIAPGCWTHVEHPDAERALTVEGTSRYDVIAFYDMPGIDFTRASPPVAFRQPSTSFVAAFQSLLDAGKPMVFLHHAVAGWPAWEDYGRYIGGRFHYQPATFAGTRYPDSGYRFDVRHTVSVLDGDHPICAGLPTEFTITDELYLFPVLEDEVVPLLRTSFPMHDPSQFYSADLAIRGERNSNTDWTHPTGSQLVGWIKNARNTPLVYLQFGDGPTTYGDPSFQLVLSNALSWAASTDAAEWASTRYRPH